MATLLALTIALLSATAGYVAARWQTRGQRHRAQAALTAARLAACCRGDAVRHLARQTARLTSHTIGGHA